MTAPPFLPRYETRSRNERIEQADGFRRIARRRKASPDRQAPGAGGSGRLQASAGLAGARGPGGGGGRADACGMVPRGGPARTGRGAEARCEVSGDRAFEWAVFHEASVIAEVWEARADTARAEVEAAEARLEAATASLKQANDKFGAAVAAKVEALAELKAARD